MSFEFINSILAGLAVGLGTAGIQAVREWLDARRKLKEAEETRFQTALASDSLVELGGYLDGPIGSFLVAEYVDNPTVKQRVNSFLARLEEFVGKTSEVPQEAEAPAALELGPEPIRRELEDVEIRLQEGRPWDALALL